MTGITYADFLDPDYEPPDSDLVCEFRLTPAADMDMESAGSRVASESSTGRGRNSRWTAVSRI